MITLLIFFMILSLLVVIHEFGHFIAAKKNGVLVEEFGLGLPPRIWGKKIGETIYSLNWLPIGGFVKVLGEEEAELSGKTLSTEEKKRTFVAKKPHQKLIILTAGIIMNIILAMVIYYPLLAKNNFKSEPVLLFKEYHFRFGREQKATIIAGTTDKSPAKKAGLSQGDVVEKIKLGKTDWKSVLGSDELITSVNNAGHTPITLETTNLFNGIKKDVQIVPIFDKKLGRNIIGVQLVPGAVINYQNNRVLSGVLHSYNMMAYNTNIIASLISTSFIEKNIEPLSSSVSGPIGIFDVLRDLIKQSGKKLPINLLNFTALLSLSLATINIFPFPALDGGRAAVVLYEWISRRKINPTIERRLNMAGFAVLISLIILITINDIARMIK